MLIKRLIDIVISLLGMILLASLFFLTALVVYIAMGASVMFHQTRPRLHGKPFEMLKFCTIQDVCDAKGINRDPAVNI